jgi:hypothetical protein
MYTTFFHLSKIMKIWSGFICLISYGKFHSNKRLVLRPLGNFIAFHGFIEFGCDSSSFDGKNLYF